MGGQRPVCPSTLPGEAAALWKEMQGEEGDEGDDKRDLLHLWWCQLSHGDVKPGCQLTAQKEVPEG